MKIINIEDLRSEARRRLPRVIFDYLDGGADGEITLRQNCLTFEEISFRPRQAVFSSEADMSVSVLGTRLPFPAILAPVGYSRLMHSRGEVAAASAAGKAGIIYTLSTISGCKLEDVKAATQEAAWYQVYFIAGRDVVAAAIERAKRVGFSALVVTVDTPFVGMRERDHRNGAKELVGNDLISKIPYLPQILLHPRWLIDFLLDGGVPDLQNIVIPGKGPMPLVDVTTALHRTAITWDDVRWLRQIWDGPIVVKGVLSGDDALRAIDVGATAVVVSNHGGRQLDCTQATLCVLPEVVEAVNGQAEVLMDGGIRRGSDIVKALCLGARAVLIGRAYAYGLAAYGEEGVTRALDILREDVQRTLRLLGCSSIANLDRSYLGFPKT
jgi:isopentenyl diphosphate isomerase/L-lactate dehydrogenase-like FMN-dependent dehydrogenase